LFQLIDLTRVRQTMGELSVFDYVAVAYLGQLPAWRADFVEHSHTFDRRLLTALVHKMKGSCQAVAALGVAQEFAQAERDLPSLPAQDWPACQARLAAQLVKLEAEIRHIMGRAHGG
jgi:hypothetical protein